MNAVLTSHGVAEQRRGAEGLRELTKGVVTTLCPYTAADTGASQYFKCHSLIQSVVIG